MPIYCGIDPSLRSSGVVLIRTDGSYVKGWQIKTVQTEPLPMNLLYIVKQISQVPEYLKGLSALQEFKPIEGVAIEAPFVGNNKMTAHVLSAVYGAIVATVMSWKPTRFIDGHPSLLKRFVSGKSQCDKDRMMVNIYKLWKFEDPCTDIVEAFAMAHIARCLDYPEEYSIVQRTAVKDYLRLKNAVVGIESETR